MLTEVCQYLHNWFDRNQVKYHGNFTISNGVIFSPKYGELAFLTGQHFRIIGSVLNDGVFTYPSSELSDESFEGTVCGMAIPRAVLSLISEIEAWQSKYGGVDSVNLSPFNSESFGGGGYSYTKGGANGDSVTWESAFASRLKPWRKLP